MRLGLGFGLVLGLGLGLGFAQEKYSLFNNSGIKLRIIIRSFKYFSVNCFIIPVILFRFSILII